MLKKKSSKQRKEVKTGPGEGKKDCLHHMQTLRTEDQGDCPCSVQFKRADNNADYP